MSEGARLTGGVRVFVGLLLIGEVTVRIVVGTSPSPARVMESATRYRRIFASYSHRDAEVVRELSRCAELIGDEYLIDVKSLRSGERWSPRLAALIESADIFQLFWSRSAMRSPHVRHEWEHALTLRRPGFVRPFYWEQPFPEDPDSGLPPEALRALHFARLEPIDPPRPTPAEGVRARPSLRRAVRPIQLLGVVAVLIALLITLWILSR